MSPKNLLPFLAMTHLPVMLSLSRPRISSRMLTLSQVFSIPSSLSLFKSLAARCRWIRSSVLSRNNFGVFSKNSVRKQTQAAMKTHLILRKKLLCTTEPPLISAMNPSLTLFLNHAPKSSILSENPMERKNKALLLPTITAGLNRFGVAMPWQPHRPLLSPARNGSIRHCSALKNNLTRYTGSSQRVTHMFPVFATLLSRNFHMWRKAQNAGILCEPLATAED